MNNITKQEALDKIEELKQYVQNLDKPVGRWKPNVGERLYNVLGDGDVIVTHFGSDSCDMGSLNQGGVFKTKEDAEYEVLRREAMANRWLPEEGEEYYAWKFGYKMAEFFGCFISVSSTDLAIFIMGNCHKTREDAEAWGAKYDKAFRVLWDRSLVERN